MVLHNKEVVCGISSNVDSYAQFFVFYQLISASKTTTAGTTVLRDQEPQTGMAYGEYKGK